MRIGSLCTGIAGLELGLQYAGIETKPVFVSDIDPGACDWLDQAMPYTPNLGDFTELDELPEVDIITAGFPCQPVSQAGLRQGIHDERWLFDDICRLVSRMDSRPVLFLENVSGILTANSGDAMGRVVYGLADIGYHISWGTLPASAVGAPQRRNRWWGRAYPADTSSFRWNSRPRLGTGQSSSVGRDGFSNDNRKIATHSDGAKVGHEQIADTRSSSAPVARHDSQTTADPDDPRRSQHSRSESTQPQLATTQHPCNTVADSNSTTRPQRNIGQATRRSVQHWDNTERRDLATLGQIFAQWAPAVARWEHVLGRSAPAPHIDGRLNPGFVEWMMGYPEGWVTDIMTKRTHSLKALGNAVVPQCAAEAFLQLSTR